MPEYRRSFITGGTFFFTIVTYKRQRILTSPEERSILHEAWQEVKQRFLFVMDAVCLRTDYPSFMRKVGHILILSISNDWYGLLLITTGFGAVVPQNKMLLRGYRCLK